MQLPSSQQLQAEIESLNTQTSDPAIIKNAARMKELAADHARVSTLLNLVSELEKLHQEQADVVALGSDSELAELANEDQARLARREAELTAAIEDMLILPDPRDARDVILEIRAGAGGEEATLFANELFRAYARYAADHGWSCHMVSQSPLIAEINGQGVFGRLKWERGVHRVQRVPDTEKVGRIHTSTVTVAVLPQAEEQDIIIRPEDLRIDTYRAGGAGGQHVNKTSSAVRITHIHTGTVVAVQDERSQHKNKDKAMKILRARILEAQEQAAHAKQAAERRSQIGTGDRSEKIRTYNFPQDRVTDHRIKKSWSNIPSIMDGALDRLINDLAAAERELKLANAQ